MKNKKCNKCQKIRLIKFFNKRKASIDGLQKICKDCSKLNSKNYYINNKAYYEQRYLSNKDSILSRNREWNKHNKDKILKHKQRFHQNNPTYHQDYTKINKEILNEKRRIRESYRSKTDTLFKLKKNYRNRIYDYYSGTNRSKRSKEIIGLSWDEFKNYLESKFQPGMNWDNYGAWHIDHIVPLCSASNEIELEKLFYYTNCRPLWAKENIQKGGKIIF